MEKNTRVHLKIMKHGVKEPVWRTHRPLSRRLSTLTEQGLIKIQMSDTGDGAYWIEYEEEKKDEGTT